MPAVCITFAWGKYVEWKLLYDNCLNSFKKWHPDIEMKVIGYEGDPNDLSDLHKMSLFRFTECRKLFDQGYTKVILIGLDTFATARWDELIDDNETPVIATLGGPYAFDSDGIRLRHLFFPKHGWYEHMFVGADQTCYNSKKALDDLIAIQHKYKIHDNHAITLYINELNTKCTAVGFPYITSPFVYNGLTAFPGCIAETQCVTKTGELRFGYDGPIIGKFSPSTRFLPIDDKLYNHVGKHIKSFCFDKNFNRDNIHTYLNQETIAWLKKYCDIDLTLADFGPVEWRAS